MRSLSIAIGACLALLAWSGVAAAADAGPAAQAAGQLAGSDQAAGALSGTSQVGPTNRSIDVRVLSPGSSGSTTQSNTAASGALALNGNATTQGTSQTQSGGGDQAQIAGQSASNEQAALAAAKTAQLLPSNDRISVRVLSPGSSGNVEQSNTALSGAVAGNGNATGQTIDQAQGGGGGGSGTAVQDAGQSASNEQAALAHAGTAQIAPSNESLSVRVLSPGDDGDVTQSNTALSGAVAANLNAADQSVEQDQAGGGDAVQAAGQEASNGQAALAGSETVQLKPSNGHLSVPVLSGHGKGGKGGKADGCGCEKGGGDVDQSNTAASLGVALNANATSQDVDQTQAGGAGTAIQAAGQSAGNLQIAGAKATTFQLHPTNTHLSVPVLSPERKGHGPKACGCEPPRKAPECGCRSRGDVDQSNTAASFAGAVNLNETEQSIDQAQRGGGGYGLLLQAAGQDAWSAQLAGALGETLQGGRRTAAT